MPEGPEVKSITDQLKIIEGYEIRDFTIYKEFEGKYKLSHTIGKYVNKVFCFGKKIAFQLNEGYIVTSLIMTGKWLLHNKDNKAIIEMNFLNDDINGDEIVLFYHDDRRMGDVSFYTDEEFNILYRSIGLDFLNDNITEDEFYDIVMKSKNMMICNFLIDQKKISGIGNYLRCDIMYHAEIDPFTKMKDLSDDDIFRLYDSCECIIRESYQQNGYSIGDGKNNYMLPLGQRGGYEPLIYKRKQDHRGNKVEKYKRKGAQTIYYVPL